MARASTAQPFKEKNTYEGTKDGMNADDTSKETRSQDHQDGNGNDRLRWSVSKTPGPSEHVDEGRSDGID